MIEHRMPIPSRVYNAAVGGHVCGPEDIDFGQKVIHLIKYDRNGNEVSFESQVTQANKIYVIHDDFTLSSNVTIPDNCVLEFDGGSVNGAYTITGNNTDIITKHNNIFSNDIGIAGTWLVDRIFSSWFKNIVGSTNKLEVICNFLRDDIYQELIIEQGTYNFSYENPTWSSGPINLASNTKLILNGILDFKTYNNTDACGYAIVHAYGKSNVTITGNGKIYGDRETNNTNTEQGHGILLYSNTPNTMHNFLIEGITVEYTSGDSINLGHYIYDVEIRRCRFKYARRVGVAIYTGERFNIHDNYFEGIGRTVEGIVGKRPMAAIEIEADGTDQSVIMNCLDIKNNTFKNNEVCMLICPVNETHDVNIDNNYSDECHTFINAYWSNGASEGTLKLHNLSITNNVAKRIEDLGLIIRADRVKIENNTIEALPTRKPTWCTVMIDGYSNNYMEGMVFKGNTIRSIQAFYFTRMTNCTFENNIIEEYEYRTAARNEPSRFKINSSIVKNNKFDSTNINFSDCTNCIIEGNYFKSTYLPYGGSSPYVQINVNDCEVKRNIIDLNGLELQYPVGFSLYASDGGNDSVIFIANRFLNFSNNNLERAYNNKNTVNISNLVIIPEVVKGPTTNRPSSYLMNAGNKYYDTDLNKYVLWNGTSWVNVDGSALS